MMKQSTGIGILIRNRRKELGMNQAELSKRSTLSQAHVSRIEAGISYPSVFTILKLAKGLQLPPEALIAAAEPHGKWSPGTDEADRKRGVFNAVRGMYGLDTANGYKNRCCNGTDSFLCRLARQHRIAEQTDAERAGSRSRNCCLY